MGIIQDIKDLFNLLKDNDEPQQVQTQPVQTQPIVQPVYIQQPVYQPQVQPIYQQPIQPMPNIKTPMPDFDRVLGMSQPASYEEQRQWRSMNRIDRGMTGAVMRDSDRDGVPDKYDSNPHNPYEQNNFQRRERNEHKKHRY